MEIFISLIHKLNWHFLVLAYHNVNYGQKVAQNFDRLYDISKKDTNKLGL